MLDDQVPRRVVPRWRDSTVTGAGGEYSSNAKASYKFREQEYLADKLNFINNKNKISAIEAMYVAEFIGDKNLAATAARAVEAGGSISSILARATERCISRGSEFPAEKEGADIFIREARRLLRIEYKNPVLLIDLARAITVNGRASFARRFVQTAVQLAPENRFVVRSAARYFLHIDEVDVALHILSRSPLLNSDPWVQASEIAVSSVAGKSSKLVKRLDDALQKETAGAIRHTELMSAVATVHLLNGNEKKAKRLFQKSLSAPNENSVAQAEWAARKIGIAIPEIALQTPFSFEANSAHRYRSLNIEGAIEAAERWKEDESFSSRPLHWLGYLYALNDDPERSSEYHQRVVMNQLEPSDTDLLNLNFSRIESGAIEVAAEELEKFCRSGRAKDHLPQILANVGALHYTIGDVDAGRQFYERSMAAARARGDARTESLSRAFFARAATKFLDPQRDRIVADATNFQGLASSPGAMYVVKRLVNDEVRKRLESSAQKKVLQQKLSWDPLKNVLSIN